jgi:hypothetical protein
MTVWVLVFLSCGYRQCGPAVIDNITSREECMRVANVINESYQMRVVRCIEVRKSK